MVRIHNDQPPHPGTGQDFYGCGAGPTGTHDADGGFPQSACRLVAKRGSKSSYRLEVTSVRLIPGIDVNRLGV